MGSIFYDGKEIKSLDLESLRKKAVAPDNITQKKVSEAIDKLNCTRIVIAHRLSTIRHCDRIIVLDKVNIAESGTYEELIEKNGLFSELVKRQRVEVE